MSGINTVTQAPSSTTFTKILDMLDALNQDNVFPNALVLSSATNIVLAKLLKNSEANNYADPPVDIARIPKFITEAITASYVLMGDFTQLLWGVRQEIAIKREPQVDRNAQLVSVSTRIDFALQHKEAMCLMSA